MLSNYVPISLDEAIAKSPEEFVWSATLRSADVILEQPGLSSDHLPREEVVRIEYIPTRQKELPVITCRIDLDKGERFVRYWTTLHQPQRGQAQRLYCVGVEAGGRYAILAFYPMFKKILAADRKPFCPPWFPETFAILPPTTILRGGQGQGYLSWFNDGFGGHVQQRDNQLVFSAIYE
jgi:hypothetical protein